MPPKSRWETSPSPPPVYGPPPRKKVKKPKKEEREKEKEKEKERQERSRRQKQQQQEEEQQRQKEPELPPPGPIRRYRPQALQLGSCRSSSAFEVLGKISAGSYGEVKKGREKETGELVALKGLKYALRDGFPITALREIALLRRCMECENVVRLIEVVEGGREGDISLVLPYHPYPLSYVLHNDPPPFSQSDIKCIVHQLLSGLSYLHNLNILHRDLKPSNLLLASDGTLKIADFGMARFIPALPGSQLTHPAQAFTLWYRAPELLLGAREYGFETDIWSAGVIFLELLKNKVVFKVKHDYLAVAAIFELLGPPDNDVWPGFREQLKEIRHYEKEVKKGRDGKSIGEMIWKDLVEKEGVRDVSVATVDLVAGMMALDPRRRPAAGRCLMHPYFREEPRMKPKEFLPTFPSVAEDD